MLLEQLVLADSAWVGELLPDSALCAAAHWHHREGVEVMAANAFATLSEDLELANASASLVKLAAEAAAEELRHTDQCRAIVRRLAGRQVHRFAVVPKYRRRVAVGPAAADPRARAFQAAVGLGAITESLSTALLVEIRRCAEDALVAETAHAILRDEVRHSRLGWACIEHYQRRGWLHPMKSADVHRMIDGALTHELEEVAAAPGDLEGFGVLSGGRANRVCTAVLDDVVWPGLRHFGVVGDA